MLQNIIVLLIIAGAIIYSITAIYKNIQKKDSSACGDCNGCDLKSEIAKNKTCKTVEKSSSCGCS